MKKFFLSQNLRVSDLERILVHQEFHFKEDKTGSSMQKSTFPECLLYAEHYALANIILFSVHNWYHYSFF